MSTSLRTAACGLAVLLLPRVGAANEPPASELCSGTIRRTNVVACAMAVSPSLKEELASQRAVEGRREAARPFLPSNPVLGGSVASRTSPAEGTANWSLSLGQELEVAGQRGLRVEVADRELRAQIYRVTATRADIAAQAWTEYFAALAVQERLKLAIKSEEATGAVASTVRAMAASGLSSELDADIADAAALRAAQDRLGLEGLVAVSKARLYRLTGVQPAAVAGVLEPVKSAVVPSSVPVRHERLALQEEEVALRRRVDLLRRERVPNPTVSLFAQNDGFDERVLGLGLSIPIPLPQPVGRTLAGEIAETTAGAEKVGTEAERVQRDFQLELAIAAAEFDAASKARALYTAERVERAAARLESIAVQVKAARLPVRDALVGQQSLVDQLKAEIDAREALCVASVRLARAAGLSLEGDSL